VEHHPLIAAGEARDKHGAGPLGEERDQLFLQTHQHTLNTSNIVVVAMSV